MCVSHNNYAAAWSLSCCPLIEKKVEMLSLMRWPLVYNLSKAFSQWFRIYDFVSPQWPIDLKLRLWLFQYFFLLFLKSLSIGSELPVNSSLSGVPQRPDPHKRFTNSCHLLATKQPGQPTCTCLLVVVLHLEHFNVNQYAFELHQSFLSLFCGIWSGLEHFFWLFLFRYDFMA